MGTSRVEQAEQKRIAALAKAAIRKEQAGETPNRQEMAAWRKYEAAQREKYGRQYLEKVPKRDYVAWSGRQGKVLNEQADSYGFPLRGPTLNVIDVIRHLHDFLAANKFRLMRPLDDDDPLMSGVSSPALERYRAARADISEDERDRNRGQLLPRHAVHTVHAQWALKIKHAGERLQKRFGDEAREILDDALDDCEKLLESIFLGDDDA